MSGYSILYEYIVLHGINGQNIFILFLFFLIELQANKFKHRNVLRLN